MCAANKIKRHTRWGVTALVLVLPFQLFAEDNAVAKVVGPVDPLSGENLFRLFGGLALVLALVVGLIWFLKRIQGFPGGANGSIKLVGALALGQREKLVVVQLGDQQLALGVTPGRINALHVLEKNLEPESATSSDIPFSNRLKNVIEQRAKS